MCILNSITSKASIIAPRSNAIGCFDFFPPVLVGVGAWGGIFKIPGCLVTGDDGITVPVEGSVATVAGSNSDTFLTEVDWGGVGGTGLAWLIGAWKK